MTTEPFPTLHLKRPLPKIAVLVLGRKRPGFDPVWGGEVATAIRKAIREAGYDAVFPEGNIADDASLRAALSRCSAEGARVLVVTQPTISDGKLAPIIARTWQGQLVLWATTERQTGEMISANSLVGTHVFGAMYRHLHVPYELVYGHPDDPQCRADLERSLRVAAAADAVSNAKVGLAGNHAPGFIDFHADPVTLSDSLGAQLFHMSVPELLDLVQAVPEDEAKRDVEGFTKLGLPYRHDLTKDALLVQSRFYLAVSSLLTEEHLDAFSFRCWPELPNLIGQWPYVAASRFMSEGKAVVMEGDLDGAIASLLLESLGVGPIYTTDWLEHDRENVTIWHTGAVPLQFCDPVGTPTGPTIAVHFNNKKPTVIEATIRAGLDMTLCRLWHCDGQYHLCAIEGESVKPKRHLLGTNGVFRTAEVDVRTWFDDMIHEGMPHHVHLVRGHHKESLRRLARLLNVVWH